MIIARLFWSRNVNYDEGNSALYNDLTLTFVSGAIHYNASHHERQNYQPPNAPYNYDLWVWLP